MVQYTNEFAEERKKERKVLAILPSNRITGWFFKSIGLCFVLSYLCLFVPVFKTVEAVDRYLNGRNEKNRSYKRGSVTAKGVLYYRGLLHKMGFGSDYLASDMLKSLLFNSSSIFPFFTHVNLNLGLHVLSIGYSYFYIWLDEWLKKFKSIDSPTYLSPINLMHTRTCFLDDVVSTFGGSFDGNQNLQLVILGAGYDTRCYRLNRLSKKDFIKFEVDADGSQMEKIEVLKDLKLYDSKRVKYVPCDFVHEDWLSKLKENGFDPSIPVCIIWEGVSMYLEKETNLSVFQKFAQNCASGSIIAFDVMCSDFLLDENIMKAMKDTGEPWVFGIDNADGLSELLESSSESLPLKVVDHISLEESGFLYLPDGLGERNPNNWHFFAVQKI